MRHAISVDAKKAKWTDAITSFTAHLTTQAVHVMRSVPMNNVALLVVKEAKYEIQKPSTCRATLFRCKFWPMFGVFHLA